MQIFRDPRYPLLFAAFCVFLDGSLSDARANQATDGPPNIILILTDDHGWSQMSVSMDPEVTNASSGYLETPQMTRLANEGMRFTSGYSPAPLCTPTRRSILCGTSSARSGTEFDSPWIPAEHLTIPKALKRAAPAYQCAHFGKWGESMISTPEECGYDESDGETANRTGGTPSTLGIKGGNAAAPPHFIDNIDPKRTSSMTSRAIEFMEKQNAAEAPFFLQVSYYAQHLSIVSKEKTLKKYNDKGTPDRAYTAAWAAMLEELDDGVGRLLGAIEDLEISGRTYVFFTGDNGGRGTLPGGDDSQLPPNYPLSGAKAVLLEGGIRVPFIVRGPIVEPGSVCRIPVVGYDLLPTFADLAGGNACVDDGIDGTSFKSLLSNSKAESLERPIDALFFHRPSRKSSAVRQGDYKLMIEWTGNRKRVAARQLYDLSQSPIEEGNDIAAENPEVADHLEKLLFDHLKEVGALSDTN